MFIYSYKLFNRDGTSYAKRDDKDYYYEACAAAGVESRLLFNILDRKFISRFITTYAFMFGTVILEYSVDLRHPHNNKNIA